MIHVVPKGTKFPHVPGVYSVMGSRWVISHPSLHVHLGCTLNLSPSHPTHSWKQTLFTKVPSWVYTQRVTRFLFHSEVSLHLNSTGIDGVFHRNV